MPSLRSASPAERVALRVQGELHQAQDLRGRVQYAMDHLTRQSVMSTTTLGITVE